MSWYLCLRKLGPFGTCVWWWIHSVASTEVTPLSLSALKRRHRRLSSWYETLVVNFSPDRTVGMENLSPTMSWTLLFSPHSVTTMKFDPANILACASLWPIIDCSLVPSPRVKQKIRLWKSLLKSQVRLNDPLDILKGQSCCLGKSDRFLGLAVTLTTVCRLCLTITECTNHDQALEQGCPILVLEGQNTSVFCFTWQLIALTWCPRSESVPD